MQEEDPIPEEKVRIRARKRKVLNGRDRYSRFFDYVESGLLLPGRDGNKQQHFPVQTSTCEVA